MSSRASGEIDAAAFGITPGRHRRAAQDRREDAGHFPLRIALLRDARATNGKLSPLSSAARLVSPTLGRLNIWARRPLVHEALGRDPKTKAIAEVLRRLPTLTPKLHHPRPVRETDSAKGGK
jgi:hypothetical protein